MKISYSSNTDEFIVSEYRPTQGKVVVIDRGDDLYTLGQKHGLFCEDPVSTQDSSEDGGDDEDDFSALNELFGE